MQKQRSAFIAAALAVLVVLVLAVGFFFTGMTSDNAQYTVTLPSEMETVNTANTPLSTSNLTTVQAVTITTDNVQSIIASLARPTSYSCSLSNTLYWGEESGSLLCNRYVREGAERIDTLNSTGTVTGVQVIFEDTLWLWQTGDTKAVSAPLGNFSTDTLSMWPDYQTVLDLPAQNLLSVTTTPTADDIQLTVTAVQDDCTVAYTLSVLTGLLLQADYLQDGTLLRTVVISPPSQDIPSSALFILPAQDQAIYE